MSYFKERIVVTVLQLSSSLRYVKTARNFRALSLFTIQEITDRTRIDTMSHFWIAEVTFWVFLYANRKRLVSYKYNYCMTFSFSIFSLRYQFDYNTLLTTDSRLYNDSVFLVVFFASWFLHCKWVGEKFPLYPECSHSSLDFIWLGSIQFKRF